MVTQEDRKWICTICLTGFFALLALGVKIVSGIGAWIALVFAGLCFLGAIYSGCQWWKHRKESRILSPSIITTIEQLGNDWYVRIENEGGVAVFEAIIQLISANGRPVEPNDYIGYWETIPHCEARIVRGSPKRLKIGGVAKHNQGLTEFLLLYYYDPQTHGLVMRQSSLYIVGTQPPAPPKPVFRIRVTISAVPQFQNGKPVIKEYNMTLEQLEEIVI